MKAEQIDSTNEFDRLSYLWLVAGAVLMMLSVGWFSLAFAGWLAPVFLIRFVRSQRAGKGFLLTMLGLYTAYAIAWRPIINFFMFESLPVYLVLVVVMALQGSLPLLADRLLVPRLKGFVATLVYPMAVTGIFLLYNLGSPMGSFGTVGYEQFNNLVLVQLVSITGLWGLTFLVSWLGPVVNWAWEHSFNVSKIRGGLAVFGGVLGLVLLFGSFRLAFGHPPAGTVRVHGFTAKLDGLRDIPDINANLEAYRSVTQANNNAFIEGTILEAERGAQIVLWPEMAGGGIEEDANALIVRGQEVAQQENIYLAMGVGIEFPDENRLTENRLVVVDPNGEIVMDHLKFGATLVDGIASGDGILRTAETPFGILSGIICYDGNFPMIVKQAGSNGTDILLVANGEPNLGVAQLHAKQHIFRAIENGVSLVRHDYQRGYSLATDPYGRILAVTNIYNASEPLMVAQVPIQGVFTLYSVIGDLFGWLTVVGFLGLVIWAVIQRSRSE